jgi:hypothetical protein
MAVPRHDGTTLSPQRMLKQDVYDVIGHRAMQMGS